MIRLPPVPSRYALLAGLGVLLILLVAVSAFGLTRTDQINRRLQTSMQEQDAKTGLVSALFRITRERSQIIEQLFSEDDAAARTRAAERYRALADEFAGLAK